MEGVESYCHEGICGASHKKSEGQKGKASPSRIAENVHQRRDTRRDEKGIEKKRGGKREIRAIREFSPLNAGIRRSDAGGMNAKMGSLWQGSKGPWARSGGKGRGLATILALAKANRESEVADTAGRVLLLAIILGSGE